MKTGYSVRDCMTTKPISIGKHATLEEVSKVMAAHNVGALLVEDKQKPVSVITEQDIVRQFVAKGKNPLKQKVSDREEQSLVTVHPEADLYDALVLMKEYNIRHLPVVEDNSLAGLLTIKDVLKIEPALFDTLVEKFELKEEQRKIKSLTSQFEQDLMPAEKTV